jgi:hypothetical protein
MRLAKTICIDVMHEMGSLHFHPHTKLVLQEIATTFSIAKEIQ